jgi:hypothetical protein
MFLFVLIISNIFWIFRAGENVNIIKSFKQREDILESIKETELELGLLQMKSEGTRIDLSEEFLDENGKLNRLIDIVEGHPFRIVLRYSQIGCHTCIDKKIQLLNQVIPDTLMDKVVLLSKLSTKKDLVIFRRVHNLENPFYQNDKNFTPIDSINIPYFFLITKDGFINKVFIPQDGINEDMTKSYLRYISQLLQVDNTEYADPPKRIKF